MEVLLVVAAACAVLGGAIGNGKQMGGASGFLLGALLGPLGLLIVAVSGRRTALQQVQARPEAEGWHQDPLGRFDGRYYDGQRWTQHVGRISPDGTRQQFEDPI